MTFMVVRIAVFFGLVAGLAAATAAMGITVTETGSTCQVYKAC